MLDDIVLRDVVDDDLAYIRDSFFKWAKLSFISKLGIDYDVFAKEYRALIDSQLESGAVIVATSKEDNRHIYGYALCSGDSIHFIYVRYQARKIGVANRLIAEYRKIIGSNGGSLRISHKPLFWNSYTSKQKYVYNPFIFWKGEAK